MGDPKRARKKYESPRKKWDKSSLEKERKLMETYGLKNKRELRRAETILRKKRENAKNLLALPADKRAKRERELLGSLAALGLLKEKSSLDDVLSLSLEELLEKRLQTIVWRKNLAKTIKQARQFIVHGHIAINKKKVCCPGYLVKTGDVDKINYFKGPLQLEPKKKKGKIKKEEAELEEIEEIGKEEIKGKRGREGEKKEGVKEGEVKIEKTKKEKKGGRKGKGEGKEEGEKKEENAGEKVEEEIKGKKEKIKEAVE